MVFAVLLPNGMIVKPKVSEGMWSTEKRPGCVPGVISLERRIRPLRDSD